MKNNPQINNFLDVGIKRFADRGIDGIRIDEMCDEVGVAKTSFYHYFGSKNSFVEKLFDYWYDISTGGIYDQIKHIDDALLRFTALKKLIDSNKDAEYCYLQLKLYASNNEYARKIVDNAKKKRFEILFEIFKMAGQSDEEATSNVRKMILTFFGRLALTHGYTGNTIDIDIPQEELMQFLGLKK